jgi:hypothetical protein
MKKQILKPKPNAWVVSSKDKGRKSIKNGKVYLKNKENFEIELFNPLSENILADIKINKTSISENGLIVKPGQRVYLDCFIDDLKKFIFETYNIEESPEAKEAISNNGVVDVYFYKEEVKQFNIPLNQYWYGGYQNYPITYPHPYPWRTYTTNTGTSFNLNSGYCTLTNNSSSNSTLTNNSFYSSTLTSDVLGLDVSSSIETGRVERGDVSNQNFQSVEMDFESYCISSVSIMLLPESIKPIEIIKKKGKSKNSDGVIELINKLHNLLESDVITEEEFSNKKKELLNRI